MPVKTDEEVTITISGIPSDLLEDVDRFAAEEDRTRSNFLKREIEQIVERRKAREAKK